MAKAPIEIRSLARSHTEAAINTLLEINSDRSAAHSARVAAANSLLDRGWGKPSQPLTGEDEGPVKMVIEWASKNSS
jgi:hypothetical protein